MADKNSNYLDSNGVLYFWQKIKELVTKNKVTKTSELTNDSGYITSADVPEGAMPSSTVPGMDGEASVGTETKYARGDHRHPTDTSRASAEDLTAHTGNTTIHVTAQDKTSWNGKADKATTLAGYNIQDAMTAEEITHAINDAIGSVTGISFEIVDSLPTTGESGKIYLVKHDHGEQDQYDEYIYYNNAWEKIGSTDIDLSNYWNMDNLVAITNEEIDNIVTQ